MYFLSLTLTFAVSTAAIALDSRKRPSDPVPQTNLVSGRAVPVLDGFMGTATPDLATTQQAVDLPAQPPIPNQNLDSNLDQMLPLAFNEVPYPEFLENGRKFCDFFSTIESKECANYQNWRCCDKIDRNNFVGINCKKFEVKDPAPKKDEQQQQQQQQPQDQQQQDPPPELDQSFPAENGDLPDWLNWLMFPGATDPLWQSQ
ncbi:hypothetical protein MMC31_005526 [Peltigera leucophlebia]|nr:hypothetical protein [Peltigera leucophlebia]